MTVSAVSSQAVHRRRRFTVAEYYRLDEIGILHEDDRVELIDGDLIALESISVAHAVAVTTLGSFAHGSSFLSPVRISMQNPISLDAFTEPQPDFALVQQRRYTTSHPTPSDIFLVAEVADSALAYDRSVKLPLYATAGIPEAWIVDLNGRAIERHSAPRDGRYTQILIAAPGDSLASLTLPAFVVSVSEVLNLGGDEASSD